MTGPPESVSRRVDTIPATRVVAFRNSADEKPQEDRSLPGNRVRAAVLLKVEAELDALCSRRHVVRAAERGEEVVQRGLVGQVDHREAQTPLVPVAVEQIVFADGNVKQVTRSDARRILVVVFVPGFGI